MPGISSLIFVTRWIQSQRSASLDRHLLYIFGIVVPLVANYLGYRKSSIDDDSAESVLITLEALSGIVDNVPFR